MTTNSAAIYDLLLRQGPCSEQEVLDHLVAAGRSSARTTNGVRSSLASHPWTVQLTSGRWDHVARRLAGAVLTTRPRSRIHDGVLWVHRDLEPFACLHSTAGIPLTTGGFARHGLSGRATLVGPEGWLPPVGPDHLLALRWDGKSLRVDLADNVPAGDSEQVRRVRSLLLAHAELLVGQRPYYLDQLAFFSKVTLSALQEDPDLLRQPLPPLSELLPLPEHLLPLDAGTDTPGEGVPLTLTLPSRVFHEVERRAELLGDHLPTYAGMLLGAAVDRVLPPQLQADCGCRYVSGYDAASRWADGEEGTVIRRDWAR